MVRATFGRARDRESGVKRNPALSVRLTEWVDLFRRQLLLPFIGQLLDPAVVGHRNREHALAPHARERRDAVVARCRRTGVEEHTADEGGVGEHAVAVGIRVHDELNRTGVFNSPFSKRMGFSKSVYSAQRG